MPVRKGHPATKNSFAETIIRKFESQNRVFLIFNNTLPLPRIIYSSDKFQELSGFSRHDVMQYNCRVTFLHGPRTDLSRIAEIENGVHAAEELQVEVWLYKKDELFLFSDCGRPRILILSVQCHSVSSSACALCINLLHSVLYEGKNPERAVLFFSITNVLIRLKR
ncbi:putative Potassium voltage-gated channel subfamily H member 7 [Hypsibius exemplaris]|uniref:Potassium voltage-gated channel subfamily H member 7 n=1 Tax=Hypsibius exemplaris TaxID=2072580 RepID=A0A9X6NPK0_HYPEX|nr:putative Potassium voltage-gated channel subfamily H member 7 [Hypsibius exemplaris]